MLSDEKPLLLPTPQKIDLTGGQTVFDPHKDPIVERITDRSQSERYKLTISPEAPIVTIEANNPTGIRHGHRTLQQLVRQYGRSLPTLVIEDYPSFPVRGVMLDISRNRVPTMEHLSETIDLLASWKINHFQLYTEHTFAYAGHETAWKDASPITPDEIKQLDRHCRDLGVTLAANQNCFGHMTQWLKHKRYADLAETHDGWFWGDMHRSEPFSLCPIDPNSIALIEVLLGRLLPNFTSGLVNIGCDETFDIGQGRSKDVVNKRGRAAIYFDFIIKIVEIVHSHGFQPMFWADIALSHPELLDRIPADMIALAWGYEPDASFDLWCRRLRNVGREVWVCPGTSSWRSITGRTFERRHNIINAAEQGCANGATGFLITDWGDMGHRQQWSISLNALAEAADAAWNAGAASRFDPRATSLHAFGDDTGQVGPWLDELGDVDLDLRKMYNIRNATALFTDLHNPLEDHHTDSIPLWKNTLDHLDDLRYRFPENISDLVADELKHTIDVARLAARQAIMRRMDDHTLLNSLACEWETIIEEHRRLWLLRSRPGGLDDSCQYYEDVIVKP